MIMNRFRNIFNHAKCNVIGMIHVGALPGTPCYEGSISRLVDRACKDAEIYKRQQVDGVLLENMNDIPYIQANNMGPEITATMTYICSQIRTVLPSCIKCGVQVLAGGNKEALAVALAADLQFIRVEGFVFSHIADEGFTNACAGSLLRYRHTINADNVLLFTDIKKKHSSHAITSDTSLGETLRAAEFFLSDGIVLTGTVTGDPVHMEDLKMAKQIAEGPVILGSGVTSNNIHLYKEADAVIVGTDFKKNRDWRNDVDYERVAHFMEKIHEIRICNTKADKQLSN